MARKLIDEAKSEWVPETDLVADGDADASYQIRQISVDTYREIVKRHTTLVPNPRTHRRDEKIDTVKVSDEVFDYCLIGWKGIYDGDKEAPCEFAQKKKLPAHVIAAIAEWAQQAGGGHAEERKASFRAAH